MRPGQVLDSRNDLSERLSTNQIFREQVAYLLASQMGDLGGTSAMLGDKVRFKEVKRRVLDYVPAVDAIVTNLKVGEVYRVTEDMSAMVQFAASQLDETDLIDTSLAPTQAGIARFDKGLPLRDIRGNHMLVHWVVWGPGTIGDKSGVIAWTFNDPHTEADEVHTALIRDAIADGKGDWYSSLVGRFATVGVSALVNGAAVGPAEVLGSDKQILGVLADGQTPLPGTNDVRYIHALWLLLNQSVTRVEKEDVDRPARRRAGKMRLPGEVTVIRLRREVSDMPRGEGESQVEWQHRWIVRGHWRWQAYGPGRSERRRIWINPFVKGPESAPFKQTEKVYSLDR